MAKTNKKTAFGLIRVSTSEQDLQSQKDALVKIANEYGYTIVDNSEGNDFFSEKITGYDEYDYDRDSIKMLKMAIRVRKPDAIFIWELSRLTRNATKVSKYINEISLDTKIPMYFADYKLWTIDPETGKIDNDAVMKIQGGAMAVEIERERIKQRTSRGRDAKAEQGYYVGHLKDGYIWVEDENGNKVFKVDEVRKPTILKIYELYLDKQMSTGEIRDYLNAHLEEHPSPNKYRYTHPTMFKGWKNEYHDRSGNIFRREDALWTDAMVSNILKDEWYAGIRRYHGEPHPIEPIVSKERWEACDKRLAQFRKRISTAKQPYLLGGLLYCGICGRKLYGHSDGGYNDMYYCSSVDFGKEHKCGLKWLRRQNMDAILVNIVKQRVYEDISKGEKSPFSNFFSIDDKRIKDLNEKSQTYKALIRQSESEIDKLNKRIDFYIQQQGKYYNNPALVEKYQIQIDEIQNKIGDENGKILDYEIAEDKLKKQKRMLASVKDKVVEVNNLEDYERMKELMNYVIEKIVIFNPDKHSSIIEVHYVNGKTDTVVYSPTYLVKKFIFLSKDDKKIAPFIRYDKETKKLTFNGYYFACGGNMEVIFNETNEQTNPMEEDVTEGISFGTWDTPENKQRFISESISKGVDETVALQLYEDAIERGDVWKDINHAKRYFNERGMEVFKDEMTVRKYIDIKRNSTLNVFDFNDLLPMSERGRQLKAYHREYEKRKNTGKSFTPFVLKDADYDRINKERKHLYNRKWKILNNKHLSQEQKDEKVFEIMEKLEAYKYQLKYLPSNKKGEQCIEKYGKKGNE